MTLKEVFMIVVSTLKSAVMGNLYTYSYLLMEAKDKGEIKNVKAQLNKEFDIKDLGVAKKYLE